MHLDLPHPTYSGPALTDEAILERLPAPLTAALRQRNGCVAFLGALHVRGACLEPEWHSLRAAWEGPVAFHVLYPEVRASDVPFAEDGLGDQMLLRDERVYHLSAESGELEQVADSLDAWWAAILAEPTRWLPVRPVLELAAAGTPMQPGQLLSAYPPFVMAEAARGVDLRAIATLDRRGWLAELARQIRDLPDGAAIELKVVP